MAKIVKSKYGFSSLKIGDKFNVKAIDLSSMKSSLSAYNKKNLTPDTKIVVEAREVSGSKVEVERIA